MTFAGELPDRLRVLVFDGPTRKAVIAWVPAKTRSGSEQEESGGEILERWATDRLGSLERPDDGSTLFWCRSADGARERDPVRSLVLRLDLLRQLGAFGARRGATADVIQEEASARPEGSRWRDGRTLRIAWCRDLRERRYPSLFAYTGQAGQPPSAFYLRLEEAALRWESKDPPPADELAALFKTPSVEADPEGLVPATDVGPDGPTPAVGGPALPPTRPKVGTALSALLVLGVVLVSVLLWSARSPEPLQRAAGDSCVRLVDVELAGEPAEGSTTLKLFGTDATQGAIGEFHLLGHAARTKLLEMSPRNRRMRLSDAGCIEWLVVGTQATRTSAGELALLDLRDGQADEVWRTGGEALASLLRHQGDPRGTGVYGFFDFVLKRDLGAGNDERPEVLALAQERDYAPSSLVLVDRAGEMVAGRHHFGTRGGLLELDSGRLVTWGMSNLICPPENERCRPANEDYTDVVFVEPPLSRGHWTRLPPPCGGVDGTPVEVGVVGYGVWNEVGAISEVIQVQQEGAEVRVAVSQGRAGGLSHWLLDGRGRLVSHWGQVNAGPDLVPLDLQSDAMCRDGQIPDWAL